MGVIKLPNGRYRAQLRRRGYPRFDKVFDSEQAAQEALAQLTDTQPAPSASGIPLAEAWARYSVSNDFETKSENTRTSEITKIKPVLKELAHHDLGTLEARPDLIYDYIDKRSRAISAKTGRKLSPATIRLELAALSSVVAWAKKRRIIQDNFMQRIERPQTPKRKRRVTTVEQGKIDYASHEFNGESIAQAGRFLKCMRLLGCRPGELSRLRLKDIDHKKGFISFRDTKNGTDRTVPATPKVLSSLSTQLDYIRRKGYETDLLFPSASRKKNPDGKPTFKPFNFSGAVRLLVEAGVLPKGFHAHAIRREFISRMIEDGMELSTLMKLTGHKSTQALDIYNEALAVHPTIAERMREHLEKIEHENTLDFLENKFKELGATEETLKRLRRDIRKEEEPVLGRPIYSFGD
ncbi:MAG: tyrosine-type recombinase/integrase [Pseudomonadota bacterium]